MPPLPSFPTFTFCFSSQRKTIEFNAHCIIFWGWFISIWKTNKDKWVSYLNEKLSSNRKLKCHNQPYTKEELKSEFIYFSIIETMKKKKTLIWFKCKHASEIFSCQDFNKKRMCNRCVRRISCRITFFDKCALIRHARYLLKTLFLFPHFSNLP